MQDCIGNCLEEHLVGAAGCMHAQHADSKLTFATGANLDLSSLSDKMFAVEAASLYAGMQQPLGQEAVSDLRGISVICAEGRKGRGTMGSVAWGSSAWVAVLSAEVHEGLVLEAVLHGGVLHGSVPHGYQCSGYCMG